MGMGNGKDGAKGKSQNLEKVFIYASPLLATALSQTSNLNRESSSSTRKYGDSSI
jgi:hypothetical protein